MKIKDGSTGGMKSHLKSAHKKEYEEFLVEEEKKREAVIQESSKVKKRQLNNNDVDPESEPSESKQPKLSDYIQKMTKYKADSAVQKKYDKLVLELLSMNFLPFNLVNSQEWRSLISFLDKRLNLKDRTTYSRQMKDIAREVQDKVKKMIKEFCGDSLAITSDMWSSRVLDSYISGTFHFIDKEFRLHRWTPICQKFEGRHTGENIQAKLDEFMEVMSIDPRVHKTCVSDNAAAMLLGVRLSELKSYGCNNHWQQLGIKNTFENVRGMSKALKTCQALATHLHHSNVDSDLLAAECVKQGHYPRSIKAYQETRWDSQHTCMDSVTYHEECLENLAKEGHLSGLVPTISEFLLIKGASTVLEECKITTKIWEAEKTPTINLVIDRVYTMIENLKKFASTASNSGSGIMFARELKKQLESRFPAYGSRVDLNCYGNYLDPSLKGLHLKLLEIFDDTKNKLGNILQEFTSEDTDEFEWQENEALDNQEEGEEDPRSKLKKLLMAKERRAAPVSNSLHSRFEKECKLYEDLPDMPPGCDVLRYCFSRTFYFL